MMKDLSREDLRSYKRRLSLFNSFSFIRSFDVGLFFDNAILEPAFNNINSENCHIDELVIENHRHLFVVNELEWDSNYFGFPCFSINLILFKHEDYKILRAALNLFAKTKIPPNAYFTINVPCEDITLIQALSCTQFNLVETRVNYFLKLEGKYEPCSNGRIEKADFKDIPYLRSVAMRMRNKFDRVHADPAFSEEEADQYLAKFAEESVKGFADFVLKIIDDKGQPFGFLAANFPREIYGFHVAKFVLAAVDNSIQKGRANDLVTEMIYRLQLKNADYITTITQAANVPAVRVWERAGFKLFKASNLYSIKND